jgi:hypothetical protein
MVNESVIPDSRVSVFIDIDVWRKADELEGRTIEARTAADELDDLDVLQEAVSRAYALKDARPEDAAALRRAVLHAAVLAVEILENWS